MKNRIRYGVLTGGLALFLAACGGQGPATQTKEITQTETVKEAPAAPDHQTSADRFGAPHAHADGEMGGMAATPASAGARFAADKPEGWLEAPSSAMRVMNFTLGDNMEAECYLSVLPNSGGGMLANVNRWRKQMSQPDYSEDEFSKLPRKTVLGQDAVYVETDGVFSGMGGTEKKEGYKLLGVVLDHQGSGVFVKMVGPAAVVDKEKEHFDAFIASLRPAAPGEAPAGPAAAPEGAMPAGHPPIAGAASAGALPGMVGGGETAPFTWTAPASWQKGADRPMRVATYAAGASGKVECVVSMLSGPAGGVDANINRWRGQMGIKETLTSAEIAALPKITILGKEAPLVEAGGDFTGMDGQQQTGYLLLGTVTDVPGNTVFVKMTGPAADVKAEKDNFIAFCQSMK